jgi:hypothetical protein
MLPGQEAQITARAHMFPPEFCVVRHEDGRVVFPVTDWVTFDVVIVAQV